LSSKAKGIAFENRVKSRLEKLGWKVIRSAASKSEVDLVAIKPGPNVLFVQCKVSEKPSLTRDEKIQLHADQIVLDVKPVIACRGNKEDKWPIKYYVFVPNSGTAFIQISEELL